MRGRGTGAGTAALVLAGVLVLLALARPVSRLTTAQGTTADRTWFGPDVLTAADGVRAASTGPVGRAGVLVLVGLALLVAALALGGRATSVPVALTAGGLLATTGLLVAADTAARAERARVVLAEALGAPPVVDGSPGPWLLVLAGALAAGAALAPRPSPPPRSTVPVITPWTPDPTPTSGRYPS